MSTWLTVYCTRPAAPLTADDLLAFLRAADLHTAAEAAGFDESVVDAALSLLRVIDAPAGGAAASSPPRPHPPKTARASGVMTGRVSGLSFAPSSFVIHRNSPSPQPSPPGTEERGQEWRVANVSGTQGAGETGRETQGSSQSLFFPAACQSRRTLAYQGNWVAPWWRVLPPRPKRDSGFLTSAMLAMRSPAS